MDRSALGSNDHPINTIQYILFLFLLLLLLLIIIVIIIIIIIIIEDIYQWILKGRSAFGSNDHPINTTQYIRIPYFFLVFHFLENKALTLKRFPQCSLSTHTHS